MKMSSDLILLDLETNGKDIPDTRVVEIGAVRLEKSTLRELDSFTILVDGRPMTAKATSVTTITDAMLEGHPKFEEAGKTFAEWVWQASRPFILSAWGVHYDIPVLRLEYNRIGTRFPFPGKTFDAKTATLHFFWLRGIGVKGCGVSRALSRLGFSFEGTAHRALDDARNEARILRIVSGLEPVGARAQIKFGRIVGEQGKVIADGPEEDQDDE